MLILITGENENPPGQETKRERERDEWTGRAVASLFLVALFMAFMLLVMVRDRNFTDGVDRIKAGKPPVQAWGAK